MISYRMYMYAHSIRLTIQIKIFLSIIKLQPINSNAYSILYTAHIRGEIWMHISGGFAALDKEPLLYQSLLNTHYDIEIGKFDKIKLKCA